MLRFRKVEYKSYERAYDVMRGEDRLGIVYLRADGVWGGLAVTGLTVHDDTRRAVADRIARYG